MILQLKSTQPFKITLTTKEKSEEYTSTPRKLRRKGEFDHGDNAIVIVGNNLGSVQITFEALASVEPDNHRSGFRGIRKGAGCENRQ